jgi:CubicO group peptidase (beta-lactamase class C family)
MNVYPNASRLIQRLLLVVTAIGLVSPVYLIGRESEGGKGKIVRIERSIRGEMRKNDLEAVIVQVSRGGRTLYRGAMGESMTGVPANPRMHARIGAVSIAFLGNLLLQLDQEGVVGIDEPVSKWLPTLPAADEVTLRMLINGTSGYADYVRQDAFIDDFYADVFQRFTPNDLLGYAFAEPLVFPPGTGWNYAHTNFVVLGLVLERATGKRLAQLLEERVSRPLGLSRTRSVNSARIPRPTLHAFTTERGIYEESTFWNPSWTLARGAIQTATIGDVARAARRIGRGDLLTPESYRAMLAPETAGLGPWNADRYYGLGVVVVNGWILQNPQFHGYSGVMAYLPSRDLAVAIFSTKGETADPDANDSTVILTRLARILSPGNVP